ncbi:UGMP family protein [Candidatus Pacearchaeota archaeon CG10_big_fil_rev_8_21_14_0_10_34_12]|nr:MAG: UGMP family protein [Candidatus Pacearchaeota archaeon CG10_big_fil_rev_8_21_14_0_10_34_12]
MVKEFILGIESTAHTFGVGIVRNGKVLANAKDTYTTEKGGIIPVESARHHDKIKENVYREALEQAKIKEEEIQGIAFSQGPGLSPCLLVGFKFAKELSKNLGIPLIPVNHCVAHLEIGKILKVKNPVMLYTSGANTQVIAYNSGKYRVFGETLDMGVGNFIDNFARHLGIGFPGGPRIEELSKKGNRYVELPYTVKGMDIALSGILTNLKQKIEKMKIPSLRLDYDKNMLTKNKSIKLSLTNKKTDYGLKDYKKSVSNSEHKFERAAASGKVNYTIADLCFSMQETVFSMLVEVSERALAHLNKKELLIGGGVGCNKRLQEMCEKMCKARKAKFFAPEKSLLVDNGAMIAFLGEVMFKSGIKFSGKQIDKLDIKPRQRTDEVDVRWM